MRLNQIALAFAIVACLSLPSFALAGPPVNDECVNALSATGKDAWNNTNATDSGPDPVDFSYDFSGGIVFTLPLVSDVWFEWTATCDGTATFSLCRTPGLGDGGFDSAMALYAGGTCGALVELATDDDSCAPPFCACGAKIADFPVGAGNEYLIRVGTLGGGLTGDGILDITGPECVPVPAVSEWGMASVALLLLTGLTIKFGALISRKAA